MAITIDATVAGESANSYLTLDEADAVFETVPTFSTTWAALTSEQKAALLIEAARVVDRRWPLLGQPATAGQARAFPRLADGGVPDQGTVDSPAVAPWVKQAQAEAVRWLHREMDEDDSADDRPLMKAGLEGFMSGEFAAETGSALAGGTEAAIKQLLRPALAGGSVHLTRA